MSKAHNDVPKELRAKLAFLRATLQDSFRVNSTPSPTSLIGRLDTALAFFTAIDDIDLERKKLLAARSRSLPAAMAVAAQCQDFLRAHLPVGHHLHQAKFIRKSGGAHKLSVAKKAAATAMRLQTRKARNVMGKRQWAALKKAMRG